MDCPKSASTSDSERSQRSTYVEERERSGGTSASGDGVEWNRGALCRNDTAELSPTSFIGGERFFEARREKQGPQRSRNQGRVFCGETNGARRSEASSRGYTRFSGSPLAKQRLDVEGGTKQKAKRHSAPCGASVERNVIGTQRCAGTTNDFCG